MKKIDVLLGACLLAGVARAAGFGLYEMSAAAMQNGGHRVGKAVDASAVYYNPATQSGLTGTVVSVGAIVLHPPLDTRVNGVGTHKMDPGYFFVPSAFVTQELPYGFNAGLGFYADYGIGSHYDNSWPLAFDSVQSDVAAYTLSPTLSYRITDKWSFAGGIRLTHMTFEQRRVYRFDQMMQRRFGYTAGQMQAMHVPGASSYPSGKTKLHYKAHNDIDVGYLLGTVYDITEDFSVGAVWRSRIRTRWDGKCKTEGTDAYSKAVAASRGGHFEEKVDLPMSANVGFNWDRALWLDKLHLGASLTWTEWSTIDTIDFGGGAAMELGWRNAYRTGFGFEYDVTDWWTPGIGYCYDWDPTREKRPATMLPAGDRHNVYFGSVFHVTDCLDVSLTGGMVIMESKTAWYNDPVGNAYKFQTRNSYTYVGMITATYHF